MEILLSGKSVPFLYLFLLRGYIPANAIQYRSHGYVRGRRLESALFFVHCSLVVNTFRPPAYRMSGCANARSCTGDDPSRRLGHRSSFPRHSTAVESTAAPQGNGSQCNYDRPVDYLAASNAGIMHRSISCGVTQTGPLITRPRMFMT
jgi:hypothetical protein